MNKQIETSDDWKQKFDDITARLEKINVALTSIAELMEPIEIKRACGKIYQEVRYLIEISNDIRYYFCSQPVDKLIGGRPLTIEEFYLLAAMGDIHISSRTGNEESYEEFRHYLYEDDERRGYIIPSQKPDPLPPISPTSNGIIWHKTHPLQIGLTPEDVRISYLKEDQKNYFEKYFPQVFCRFKNE